MWWRKSGGEVEGLHNTPSPAHQGLHISAPQIVHVIAKNILQTVMARAWASPRAPPALMHRTMHVVAASSRPSAPTPNTTNGSAILSKSPIGSASSATKVQLLQLASGFDRGALASPPSKQFIGDLVSQLEESYTPPPTVEALQSSLSGRWQLVYVALCAWYWWSCTQVTPPCVHQQVLQRGAVSFLAILLGISRGPGGQSKHCRCHFRIHRQHSRCARGGGIPNTNLSWPGPTRYGCQQC